MRRALVLIAVVLLALAVFPGLSFAYSYASITQFGSNVTVRSGERESGSITVFGGNATIDGAVEQDVTVFGGNARINGEVGHNVTVFGGNVLLGGKATVNGDVTDFGGRISKTPGATVRGNETTGVRGVPNPFTSFAFSIISLIGNLALAALVVALFPNATQVLADTIDREPWRAVGFGLLSVVLIPFIFVALLVIIIVGWAAIPFFALAIPIVFFYGFVGVARWLGRRIFASTNPAYDSPIAQVIIGALVLGIVGLIPVLGFIVEGIATLFGVGAVLISKFGTGKPWFGGRIAPGAPQPPTTEAGRGAA